MGGHGGLNILPQKKWNVYNHDNRAKVERDKRRMHERRNQENDKQIKNDSSQRIDLLRDKRKYSDQKDDQYKNNKNVSSAIEKHKKYIDEQEKKEQKAQKQQNVNLFQMEEEAINQEAQKKLDMQNSKFFEGKPFDLDTKFGGNFKNQQTVPWYTQNEKNDNTNNSNIKLDDEQSKVKDGLKKQMNEFRNKKNSSFYKVIDDKFIPPVDYTEKQSNSTEVKTNTISSNHDKKDKKEERLPQKEKKIKKDKKTKKHKHHHSSRSSSSSSSSNEKISKKEKKQQKKDKELRKQQEEEQQKQQKLQKMREERLKREKQEFYKQRELLRQDN